MLQRFPPALCCAPLSTLLQRFLSAFCSASKKRYFNVSSLPSAVLLSKRCSNVSSLPSVVLHKNVRATFFPCLPQCFTLTSSKRSLLSLPSAVLLSLRCSNVCHSHCAMMQCRLAHSLTGCRRVRTPPQTPSSVAGLEECPPRPPLPPGHQDHQDHHRCTGEERRRHWRPLTSKSCKPQQKQQHCVIGRLWPPPSEFTGHRWPQ